MSLLLMRAWCRALGHGAPWVTIRALDLRYHLCPRCGRNVFEPADFLGRRTEDRAGEAISLAVLAVLVVRVCIAVLVLT